MFIFESALLPDNRELGEHLVKHGDGVKDVAFEVDNVEWIVEHARQQGAKIVTEVHEESDAHGTVKSASIQTVRDSERLAHVILLLLVRRHGPHSGRTQELQGTVPARLSDTPQCDEHRAIRLARNGGPELRRPLCGQSTGPGNGVGGQLVREGPSLPSVRI